MELCLGVRRDFSLPQGLGFADQKVGIQAQNALRDQTVPVAKLGYGA